MKRRYVNERKNHNPFRKSETVLETSAERQMGLSVGNTLIGNTIGIDPQALYVIYMIGVLTSFPLTALRARMIDNTRSI